MADSTKTFITRIKQKFDTYSNWESTSTAGKGGNLILLRGEVAVSYLQASGNDRSLDKYFIKIGDGNTPYKDLPYISTVDSIDVPSWAKQDELPVTSTGSGEVVKGATFGTWTVGTVTYEGLKIEKTNTVIASSIYATSTIKVANPTSATQTITTLTPGALTVVGTNTEVSIGTNSVESPRFGSTTSTSTISKYLLRADAVATQTDSVLTSTELIGQQLVNKAYVDAQISGDVSAKADKVPNATGDSKVYLASIVPASGQYIQATSGANIYISDGVLTVQSGTNTTGIGPGGIETPALDTTTASIVEINNQVLLSSGATIPTTVTISAASDVVNKGYVDEKINEVVTSSMEFKGTTSSLPTTDVVNGDMYKASGTFTISAAQSADGSAHNVKVGDTIIADVTTSGGTTTTKWWYIETADEQDTWRPIQISAASIGSNTLNIVGGNHITLNTTNTGNNTSVSINHDSAGTANQIIGDTGTVITSVSFDDYGHYAGTHTYLEFTDGTHTTVNTDDGFLSWSHNSAGTTSATAGSTATNTATVLRSVGYDSLGHYSSTYANLTFVNGSHTTVSVGTNATSIAINHGSVGATSATYSATSGQYVSGVTVDAYGHVSGITQETLPTIPQISVTYSGANISVSKSTSGASSTFTVSHTKDTTVSQLIASVTGQYVHDVTLDSNGHVISASASFLPVASISIVATGGTSIEIVPIDASGAPGTAANIYTLSAYDPTTNKVVLQQDIAAFATKTYVDSTVSAAINALDASITANGSATTTQVSVFTKINEVDGKLTSTNSTSVLLATVASTGKIEDLTQTDYVIFNCGDSTTTI